MKMEEPSADAPKIEDWGSCHEVTEGADCRAVGGNVVGDGC